MLITPMSLFWLWCVVISLYQLGAKTSYLVVQAGLGGGYYQICGNYTAKTDFFFEVFDQLSLKGTYYAH